MWYYQQGSNRMGPFDEATIQAMLANGTISIDTLVWTNGMSSWVRLQQTPLAAGLPVPPPSLHPQATNAHPEAKARVAYVLLAIFLGELGIHNFYAGYTTRAIFQLVACLVLIPVIGLLTCGFGFLLYIGLWIWNIIEACTVTKDAQGVQFN
jgi:TM2 domain-containing membrane protein YozV